MHNYTWGVDGYGRQHICREGSNVVIFCVIPGCYVFDCIDALEGESNE